MAQPDHPMCTEALNALGVLRRREEEYYLTHQNLVEFWRSATRPVERNGLGLTISEGEAELQRLETLFLVVPDVPEIYREWRRLVLEYSVMGVNVHDTRLVAVMRVHSLSHILTFNIKDFTRYSSEITPVHPATVSP